MGRVPRIQKPADGAAMIAQHSTRLREVEAQQVAAGGGGGGSKVPLGVSQMSVVLGRDFVVTRPSAFPLLDIIAGTWSVKAAVLVVGGCSVVEIAGSFSLDGTDLSSVMLPGANYAAHIGDFPLRSVAPLLPLAAGGWSSTVLLRCRDEDGNLRYLPATLDAPNPTGADNVPLFLYATRPVGWTFEPESGIYFSATYVSQQAITTAGSFTAAVGGETGTALGQKYLSNVTPGWSTTGVPTSLVIGGLIQPYYSIGTGASGTGAKVGSCTLEFQLNLNALRAVALSSSYTEASRLKLLSAAFMGTTNGVIPYFAGTLSASVVLEGQGAPVGGMTTGAPTPARIEAYPESGAMRFDLLLLPPRGGVVLSENTLIKATLSYPTKFTQSGADPGL